MGGWDFDKTLKETENRKSLLRQHYQQTKLHAADFDCRHYEACKNSHKPRVINQFKGGTPGLMPFYDMWYDSKPIRVLIVGKQDNYNPDYWRSFGIAPNLDERSKGCLGTTHSKLNRHIKGTLLTLQRIFEVESPYLFASYALGNGLRCAFQKESIARNRSGIPVTSTMCRNCLPYLVREIEILEPTLIITQGTWALEPYPLIEVLHGAFGPSRLIMPGSDRRYGLYEFPKFMYLTSYNPAWQGGSWEKDYAPQELWPMIDHLKNIGYLPCISPESSAKYESMVKPVVDRILAS